MPFERALPLPWEEGWGAGKLVLASDLAGGYNPRQFRPGQHPVEGGPLRKTAVLVAAPLDLLLFFTLNREDFSFVIHLDRQPRTSRRREAQTGSRARSGSRSERTLDAVEHSRTLMEWWPFLIFHRGGLRIKVINNTFRRRRSSFSFVSPRTTSRGWPAATSFHRIGSSPRRETTRGKRVRHDSEDVRRFGRPFLPRDLCAGQLRAGSNDTSRSLAPSPRARLAASAGFHLRAQLVSTSRSGNGPVGGPERSSGLRDSGCLRPTSLKFPGRKNH